MTATNFETSIKEAAVLIPVFHRNDGKLCIILIRRSNKGVHGNQLAFPGGKSEPVDQSMRDTAIRETQEEIGISGSAIDILAALPAVETQTTNFRIFPFLARIVPPSKWSRQEHEIAEII